MRRCEPASQTSSLTPPVPPPVQFEKEVTRCIRVMEELDTVIARKKNVSQQVCGRGGGEGREELDTVIARKKNVSGEGLIWYGTGRAGRVFLAALLQSCRKGGRGGSHHKIRTAGMNFVSMEKPGSV